MESTNNPDYYSDEFYESLFSPSFISLGAVYHNNDNTVTPSIANDHQTRPPDSIDPALLSMQYYPGLPPPPPPPTLPARPVLGSEPLEGGIHAHEAQGDLIGETNSPTKKRLTALRRQQISPALDDFLLPRDISESYEQTLYRLNHTAIPPSGHSELFKPFISSVNGERHCRLCGYTQVNHTQMIQHIRDHFGVYPFACTVPGCPFSSTRRADVKKHMKEQHGTTEGYQCPVCCTPIRHERNLKRHIRTMHE